MLHYVHTRIILFSCMNKKLKKKNTHNLVNIASDSCD